MKPALFALCLASLFLTRPGLADDLDALSGKWSVKKLNDQGQSVTQTIEVKKDKFVFQIISADSSVVLHAEGDFKLEKTGPFNSARFFHIRAGDSPSNLDDVDDAYVCIYRLDEDSWTIASNFDKERDGQKPTVDVYRRVKAAPAPKPAK